MTNSSIELQWFIIIYVIVSIIFLFRWWGMTSDIQKIRELLEEKEENKEKDN